ncbi:MAG TPA: sugar phosphate isomerase/epimerase family protein [Bacteroidota bacterium]|nr:sugar phosphate isomerase/epimerase family protein [Bacteroidota bacterium]
MNPSAAKALELGIVSDEIATDFRTALRHGLSWGITRYEIRCLASGRVPHVDGREWEDTLEAVRAHGVTVTALSPGIFKAPLARLSDLEKEVREVLPRTIECAKQCGANLIIVFGVQRTPDEPAGSHELVVDLMRRAAETAARAGMKLAVENEPGFHCDTGAATRKIIDEVGSPSFGANWDPCNAFGTDEIPYPDGYAAIRPAIMNVHAKDTARGALIQCVPIGEGVIDWEGQIRALVADGIVTHVTIETHCLPLVEQSGKNVRALTILIERAAVSAGARHNST